MLVYISYCVEGILFNCKVLILILFLFIHICNNKPFIDYRNQYKEIDNLIVVKPGLQCTKPCRSPEELEQLIYR